MGFAADYQSVRRYSAAEGHTIYFNGVLSRNFTFDEWPGYTSANIGSTAAVRIGSATTNAVIDDVFVFNQGLDGHGVQRLIDDSALLV